MDFSFTVPPLKHVVSVRIVAAILKQPDIVSFLARISPMNVNFARIRRRHIQSMPRDTVINKLETLPLPPSLARELAQVSSTMIWQLLSWKSHVSELLMWHSVPNTILSDVSWDSIGSVNEYRMASKLVQDISLPLMDRFELACLYCLEKDIRSLAVSLEITHTSFVKCYETAQMVRFWSSFLNGQLVQIETAAHYEWLQGGELPPLLYNFCYAIHFDQEPAARYFWTQLTDEEKQTAFNRDILQRALDYKNQCEVNHDSNILWFLLSHMNADQQEVVFKKRSIEILDGLLQIHWSTKFMEVAEYINKHFPEHLPHEGVLRIIVNSMQDDCFRLLTSLRMKKNLMRDFWNLCPSNARNNIRKGNQLFCDMFEMDRECVKYVYGGLNCEEKINFILSNESYWKKYIVLSEPMFLNAIFQECCSTEDDVSILKETLFR